MFFISNYTVRLLEIFISRKFDILGRWLSKFELVILKIFKFATCLLVLWIFHLSMKLFLIQNKTVVVLIKKKYLVLYMRYWGWNHEPNEKIVKLDSVKIIIKVKILGEFNVMCFPSINSRSSDVEFLSLLFCVFIVSYSDTLSYLYDTVHCLMHLSTIFLVVRGRLRERLFTKWWGHAIIL